MSGLSGGSGCEWITYGEATESQNTLTLGVEDRLEHSVAQASNVHGGSLLLPAASQYTIYFYVDLSTWDAYNPQVGAGTGYFDSFSVSVTGEPYPYLAWTDPVPLPYVWGGQLYGDGNLDTQTGNFSVTVTGNPLGDNYLNVVLDTYSQPNADASYPSWGTILIARVATNGPNIPPCAEDDAYSMLHDTTIVAEQRSC